MFSRTLLSALCAFSLSFSQLSFTAPPAMTGSGGNRTITFAVSDTTDVEVSIVDVRDSSVIRHLAAGMLGSRAPAPLRAGSLSQTLAWDGRDDFGAAVAHPESLSVRVRAGMSTRLANLAGEDLYSFQGSGRSSPSLILQEDGSVLILGRAYLNAFLRKYDAAGNYVKTLFPPPAGLPPDSATAYGINVLPEGGWAPRTTESGWTPAITSSFINDQNTRMLPIGGPGEIVLVRGTSTQTISTSGGFSDAATKPLVTGVVTPAGWTGPWGPQYFTASHNPKYLYLSGWFYGTIDGGCWLTAALDTGFWADGQVFRVDRETGVVSPWLKIDSVPVTSTERAARIGGGSNAYAAIHGTAIDDLGHVFICDRVKKQIGVYDTNAALLGAVPCNDPDFVAVSKRTGAIYVLCRTQWVNLVLRKFTDWRNPGPAAATTVLTTSTGDGYTGSSVVVLTESGSSTNIWLGFGTIGFRLYGDNGSSFTLLRDFSANSGPLCFDRVAVDRATDKVYWERPSYGGGGGEKIFSIEDWFNPVVMPVYTAPRVPLNVDDLTIGPKGHLYGLGWEDFATPVTRYTTDSLHGPANYANTGKNISTRKIGYEGLNHRGLAVGWQGQVAVSSYDGFYHDDNAIILFSDTGYTDTAFRGTPVLTHTTSKSSGVRFDAAGNIYMGVGIRGPGWQTPPGFESDNYFRDFSGSIVKYAPGDTGTISGSTAAGAALVFTQPFGVYGGSGASGWCTCRSPRFDADPYGRLYIPNCGASLVSVADNAGNTILTFGRYGNTDSRGALSGPGETSPEPAIPLAWPSSAAASEDYIYITDVINARLVRVQMEYALDNIPGLTDDNSNLEAAKNGKGVTLASSPNPFNPESRVSFYLPGRMQVSLSVYDLSGRLVRTLVTGPLKAGLHRLMWNAADNRGCNVSAGVYVYRLTAGNRVLINKVVLSK